MVVMRTFPISGAFLCRAIALGESGRLSGLMALDNMGVPISAADPKMKLHYFGVNAVEILLSLTYNSGSPCSVPVQKPASQVCGLRRT